MLCATPHPLFTSPTTTTTTHFPPLRRRLRHSLSIKMSSETIEHIVLFNVKPDINQSRLNSMVDSLNGLKSIDKVLYLTTGPIHKNRSTTFNFTHMLHSRYETKDDLAHYMAHPTHIWTVMTGVLPLCNDVVNVDWVARDLAGPVSPKPGSAMRVDFVKLKEGLGLREKGEVFEVIGGLKDKVNGCFDDFSFGENFSPNLGKGFSIASVGYFPGIDELKSVEEELDVAIGNEKVKGYIDELVSVDYVVV